MTKLVSTVLLVGGLGTLLNPRPADADPTLDRCLIEAVRSCDVDFNGGDPYTVAARGYCYMIRAGMCKLMEQAT